MSWHVLFTNEAEKNIQHLPNNIVERIKDAAREIARSPFSAGKMLKGNLKGFFSFRIGDYRMVYVINKKQFKIFISYIRHRRESYK